MQKNQRKQNVLFLITRSNWGGAQRYVYDLASGLDPDRFSVVVAGGGTGEHGAPPGKLRERLQTLGIPFHYLSGLERSINPISEIRAIWQIVRLLRKIRPDVVHLNSSKMTALGGLLARILRVRTIVVTVHGFPYTAHQPRIIQWFADRITSLSFLCATDIICICQADRSLVASFKNTHKKIHLIPNGVDPTQKPQPQKEAQEQISTTCTWPKQAETHVPILATGTELHPRKGIQNVITASAVCLKRGQKLHLCIIGTGSYQKDLERQIRDAGIEEHVTFLGFVPDLAEVCSAFDGFILASHKEGLPYVLLEFGQGKVPLIASNIDGIPDIITHESTGQLIDPNDTTTITTALEKLLADPDRYGEQAMRLSEHIAHTFNTTKMIADTTTIYSSRIS